MEAVIINGLKFILYIFNYEYKDFANILGIDNSNITLWTSGKRPIPKKWLRRLEEIFPNIPVEYFQKELNEIEMLEVRRINFFMYNENDPIANYAFEKEKQVLLRLEEHGKELFDGSKAIYEVTEDEDLATHWIAYENMKFFHNEQDSITANKIYRLYIDKFSEEIVLFDNHNRQALPFLFTKGDFIIVEK